MHSKTTFAIIAALASVASVTAAPTPPSGPAQVTDTTVAAPDPAVLAASPAVAGGSAIGAAHPHPHAHHHHNRHHPNGATEVEHKHPHRRSRHHTKDAKAVVPPVSPLTATGPSSPVLASQGQTQPQTLSRREYYESLYVREIPGHPGHHHQHQNSVGGHHHHHQNGQGPHHHHPHHLTSPQVAPEAQSQPQPDVVPPTQQAAAQTNQRREYLEERGLFDFLKPHTRDLTVTETGTINKGKKVCEGLADKKARRKCDKALDAIIKKTKERNYDVDEFIKITNHHDVFVSSDPASSAKSSTSSLPSTASSRN